LLLRKIKIYEWSIKVFKSKILFSDKTVGIHLNCPTLRAGDITDVPAEFVADPFIISHNKQFYLFFEVLNKKSGRGEIGLATSMDGEYWRYERIVLNEKYHLSFPYVFKDKNEIYMIPESGEAKGIFLYRSINFPYEWEKVCELIPGKYSDSSIFRHEKKWWMFVGSLTGNLHLFYSDTIEGPWKEHPKSPVICGNHNITRPAGRVIVDKVGIYRYTQDGVPYYGKQVKSFKLTKLSETEFEEQELITVLSGTDEEGDWRKDGMHHIDQLRINEDQWLIAVDGHTFHNQYYLKWRLQRFFRNPLSDISSVFKRYMRKQI
jgi:hypothetical protein